MKKVFLVVIILYIAASLLKVHFFKIERYLSPGEGAQPFWTEAAIQYRYAKMVAEGEPIPELDRKLQYPEGIKPFSHLTIGMELVSGRLYRLLGLKIPFHIFIVYFVSFFSSLSIFSVALLSYQIWKNKFSCLISTFFYAFAIPAFFRTIGFFGREDFAMPFLFFGTFLFLKALDTEKDKKAKIIAFTSGVILALGISFWHVGRFYLSIFSIGILLFYILNIQSASSPVALLKFLLLPLLFFSIIIPVSRVNLLILSPGMIIIYAILLTDIFCKKKTKPLKNIAVLSTAALLVFLASFITYKIGEYSHVHSLIIDKIRFLGRKPSDPGMISYATRSMWIEAFLSTDPRILFHSFLLLFIPAIGSLSECISRFRKKIITKEIIFILYFTGMYLFLYLLFRGLSVLYRGLQILCFVFLEIRGRNNIKILICLLAG